MPGLTPWPTPLLRLSPLWAVTTSPRLSPSTTGTELPTSLTQLPSFARWWERCRQPSATKWITYTGGWIHSNVNVEPPHSVTPRCIAVTLPLSPGAVTPRMAVGGQAAEQATPPTPPGVAWRWRRSRDRHSWRRPDRHHQIPETGHAAATDPQRGQGSWPQPGATPGAAPWHCWSPHECSGATTGRPPHDRRCDGSGDSGLTLPGKRPHQHFREKEENLGPFDKGRYFYIIGPLPFRPRVREGSEGPCWLHAFHAEVECPVGQLPPRTVFDRAAPTKLLGRAATSREAAEVAKEDASTLTRRATTGRTTGQETATSAAKSAQYSQAYICIPTSATCNEIFGSYPVKHSAARGKQGCARHSGRHGLPLAGQINHFLSNWQAITQDEWVLSTVRGHRIEFLRLPYQRNKPPQLPFTEKEEECMQSEIQSTQDKHAILEPEEGSEMFLVPKCFWCPKRTAGRDLW